MTVKMTKDEFLNFISGMADDTEFEMIEKIVYSTPPVYIWTVNFTFGGSNLDEWKKNFDILYENQTLYQKYLKIRSGEINDKR